MRTIQDSEISEREPNIIPPNLQIQLESFIEDAAQWMMRFSAASVDGDWSVAYDAARTGQSRMKDAEFVLHMIMNARVQELRKEGQNDPHDSLINQYNVTLGAASLFQFDYPNVLWSNAAPYQKDHYRHMAISLLRVVRVAQQNLKREWNAYHQVVDGL